MTRILTLAFVSLFVVSILSGCASYTIDRANVQIKKTPQPQHYPTIKKDDDDDGPGNSEFGQSHMKPEIKKKHEEKKEEIKKKQENKKNKKERDNEED